MKAAGSMAPSRARKRRPGTVEKLLFDMVTLEDRAHRLLDDPRPPSESSLAWFVVRALTTVSGR